MRSLCCCIVVCITCVGIAAPSTKTSTTLATKKSSKDKASTTTRARQDDQIDPSSLDINRIAREIFDKTNDERRKAGLSSFSWMNELAISAAGHSSDMANRNYFSHNGKGVFRKSTASSRMQQAGVGNRMLAENIAMLPTFRTQQVRTFVDGQGNHSQRVEQTGDSYQQLTDWALEQWMNSPGHRKNILNPQLTRLGVGVALGDQNGVPYVYLTQNFAGE